MAAAVDIASGKARRWPHLCPWLVALLVVLLVGCSDEDTYTYCDSYTQTNAEGEEYFVEQCCVESCEEELDGDIDCSTRCTCTVEGPGPADACPLF